MKDYKCASVMPYYIGKTVIRTNSVTQNIYLFEDDILLTADNQIQAQKSAPTKKGKEI